MLHSKFIARALGLYMLGTFPAYAYLDPGTGSLIIQMAIAGLLGIGFTLKMQWLRIKGWFAQLFAKPDLPEEVDEGEK